MLQFNSHSKANSLIIFNLATCAKCNKNCNKRCNTGCNTPSCYKIGASKEVAQVAQKTIEIRWKWWKLHYARLFILQSQIHNKE